MTPGQRQDDTDLLSQLRLGLANTYYSMAQVFGLKRLQGLLQGNSDFTSSESPVWLLGVCYRNADGSNGSGLDQQVVDAVMADFGSKVWMTYRRGFAPLGDVGLTSDGGWGCTLRTGQMLLAQGLLQHSLGRSWRRPDLAQGSGHASAAQGQSATSQSSSSSTYPEALHRLLRWFWDSPSNQHPFSIHNLCTAGQPHGVRCGQWLGPWTLCHTLEAAVARVQPGGLCVHVITQPGGGAPVLYTDRLTGFFEEASASGSSSQSAETQVSVQQSRRAVMILVPLVLGASKYVNEKYIPQLREVLQWPQSIGIVGGRPSSSLYFIGCQDDNVLYLDPHEVQDVTSQPGDPTTYWCTTPRMMPLASVDPSLALGFYCGSLEAAQDLCHRLAALEQQYPSAPLLNTAAGHAPPQWPVRKDSTPIDLDADDSPGADAHAANEWELL